MADDTGQPGRSGGEEHNPWAPPRDGVAPGWGSMDHNEQDRKRRSVADQPTITSGSASVPPPVPPAPGAPPGVAGGRQGPAYGSPPYGSPHPSPHPSPYGQQGQPQYGGGGAAYGYPSPAPPPAPMPQPYGYGAGSVPGYGWHGAPPATGKPVAAMVIGIIGLVALITCWGSFLGIILSPVALGLGLSARKAADRGECGGRGQAVAGFAMGIIGTVLSAICVAFLVVMMVFYSEKLNDDGPGTGGNGPSLDARAAAGLP